MTLEEIKQLHCKDEKLIENLKLEYDKIKSILIKITKKIKKLEEYQQYINNQSKENQLKLINKEESKWFLKLKEKVDILEEQIKQEEEKCSEKDFEEANIKMSCNHLFYQNSEKEKTCIKCGLIHNEEEQENKCKNIKDLRMRFLYLDLYMYYKVGEKKYKVLLGMLQNEPLEHLTELTFDILKIHPNTDNELLQQKLEIAVAKENIVLIDSMFSNKRSMNSETRKMYNTYKKILKKINTK